MRNIILPLILANLLVLAWERWISPEEVADPRSFPARSGQGRDAQLVLFSSAGVAAAPAPAPATEKPELTPVIDVQRCERIGPFDSPEPASSIAQQLGRRGLTVDLLPETGDIWVGQWVQITEMESGAKARQAVERLVKAGLNDAYIVRTEPTIDISLGVFRGQAGAERVMRIARSAGLEPMSTDRYRTGTQHWVNVELHRGQALDLTDLQLQWSQILRTETVACRPTADTIADARDDSLESVADAGEPE